MTVQIKTIDLEPKRQTFGHIARRLGGDKPASRYSGGDARRPGDGEFPLQAALGAGVLALRHRQDRGRDGGLVQAARSAPVLLRDLQHRPRQHEPGGRAQLRLRRGARPDREAVGRRQRGQIERGLLPLRHLHWGSNMNMTEILPARLRHRRHRALHLLGRRSSRHGADRLPHRPRARRTDGHQPRQGQEDLAQRRRLAGRRAS